MSKATEVNSEVIELAVEVATMALATEIALDLFRASERKGSLTVDLPISAVRIITTYINNHTPTDRMAPVIEYLNPDRDFLQWAEDAIEFKIGWVISMLNLAGVATKNHSKEVKALQARMR